jgi:F420-non-reducing hydrogenase iron-sulfur subunit
MDDFEPSIIAFVCNWCTYTAADLAGTSRLIVPEEHASDPGDVHRDAGCEIRHQSFSGGGRRGPGQRVPPRRLPLYQRKLQGPSQGKTAQRDRAAISASMAERLRLTWIGASDGIQFAEIMGDLVAQIREMGPTLPDLKMVI